MRLNLPHDYNLEAAERLLCELALTRAGSIVGAAELLGITRHALKRRIIAALSDIVKMVGVALNELGLAETAGECRVTNTGTTLHLIAPGGAVVWSAELPKAGAT